MEKQISKVKAIHKVSIDLSGISEENCESIDFQSVPRTQLALRSIDADREKELLLVRIFPFKKTLILPSKPERIVLM